MKAIESFQKYAPWVVTAVLAMIALYFTTQVFLLANLPTDPRRAPDIQTDPSAPIQFVAFGTSASQPDEQRRIIQVIQSVCQQRGCHFVMFLGDNLPLHEGQDSIRQQMDSLYRAPFQELTYPVFLILGDNDYGTPFNPVTGVQQVRWATGANRCEMPSSTYFFKAGPHGFWTFDTIEQHNERGDYQAKWLASSLANESREKTIGASHHGLDDSSQTDSFFRNNICGTFDLYLSSQAGGKRWKSECGTEWITVSGAQANRTANHDEADRFDHPNPGFVWIEVNAEQMKAAFFDLNGVAVYEQSHVLSNR